MTASNLHRPLLALIPLALFCVSAFAQAPAQQPSPDNTAKIQTILSHAIEVSGGDAYLNVKTVVGRG
jgi:uncharacterized BrkB/YihY/UPF0761 family membrane protein